MNSLAASPFTATASTIYDHASGSDVLLNKPLEGKKTMHPDHFESMMGHFSPALAMTMNAIDGHGDRGQGKKKGGIGGIGGIGGTYKGLDKTKKMSMSANNVLLRPIPKTIQYKMRKGKI